ncbi:hypothetical protein BDN71DRAFT_690885 [Pleurotus eryngii]|uniref:Uncharacterized protein n=1 Tax=Pleurotus eryngii TaxID=5323 RepID=A0A9P6D8Z5_PLEER|nr:hypothetical protein BDN71DRAFT_690885 [Pleurotus eryngii]
MIHICLSTYLLLKHRAPPFLNNVFEPFECFPLFVHRRFPSCHQTLIQRSPTVKSCLLHTAHGTPLHGSQFIQLKRRKQTVKVVTRLEVFSNACAVHIRLL